MKVILPFILVLVTLVLLYDNLGSSAHAQNDPNLIPWNENSSIQFGDFQGMPNTFPDSYIGDHADYFWAFTWTMPYYNWAWQITQNQPCMYTITAFDDNAYFDKSSSWVKSEHASDMSILNHEQKHFDITEIHVRKANEIVASEFLGKQFACPSFSDQSQNDAINQKISQDLQPVFDQISQEMNQMNLDYDAQTNHGVEPQMQKEWDVYIANSLEYYEPYKDKQEIQLTQEEIKQSTLTCPPDYPYLHSDGQCWNVPEGTQQTGSDLDELNEKGLDLLHSEKYEEAISIFDEIIDKDPNDIYAYNNKGLALENLKKYDEALEYFDKALEIDPTFVITLYNKGLLLGDLERYREAIPYLDRALAIEPDDVDVLDEKGQTLASLGSHKEALEYFDKALAIEPDNTIVLFDKGFSLAEIGRHDEAISYYDLVLEQDPKDAITLNNKGYELYILGEYDEALVYLNNALEIDPDFTLAQENKELVLEEISGKQSETQSGGCLIATATYGSELAPQVQQLREIRDNFLLQTASGTSFMTGFNQFYYSFSPTIADYERENPLFKEAVKIAITPMLSTLSIMTLAEDGSESEVLGLGIFVIALNIGMYFVSPAIVIHTIRKKF